MVEVLTRPHTLVEVIGETDGMRQMGVRGFLNEQFWGGVHTNMVGVIFGPYGHPSGQSVSKSTLDHLHPLNRTLRGRMGYYMVPDCIKVVGEGYLHELFPALR